MEYKRQIAIADIHGEFELLQNLVEREIRFTPDDQLIVLGDMLDRGPQSKQVLLYLQRLRRRFPENIILLKGNHEDMCEKYFALHRNSSFNDRMIARSWLVTNGGRETIKSFGNEGNAKSVLMPFIKTLLPYYENESHIFVHGGIPAGYSDVKDVPIAELLWCRDYTYQGEMTLVVGHTPQPSVTMIGNTIIVDTGAFYSGKLCAYDVKNDRIYQSVRAARVFNFAGGK